MEPAVAVAGEEGARELDKVSYALDIEGLSKEFKRFTAVRAGYTTLKSSLLNLLFGTHQKSAHTTTVLNNLTLRIPQGASVGVIGRNGSGKSTLLKLITGIYKPTTGRIAVNGRVAALIELGAGFHPDFTGRENLYLGGVMHGLSRAQIDDRFDDIVEFAELAHVIDDPVRTYSSGMFMRLGFSLAIHTDPDVLLIDEVLAVGDAAFVAKCKDRIGELRKAGKTLILVSHDLEAVERWCDEALWLHAGKVQDRGDPRRVIDHYREFLERGEEAALERQNRELHQEESAPQREMLVDETSEAEQQRWGSREIEITGVTLKDRDGCDHLVFHPDDGLDVVISYVVREEVDEVVFGIGIQKTDGTVVHGSNTDIERVEVPALGSSGSVRYSISRLGLLDGSYLLDVAVHRKDGYAYDYHKGALKFAIRSPLKQVGLYVPPHRWSFGES